MKNVLKIVSFLLMANFLQVSISAGDPHCGDLQQLFSKFAALNDNEPSFKGVPLRVSYSEGGTLRNIGYRIFDDSYLNQSDDSILFNFVERYLLLLDVLGENENVFQRMADDHVSFLKGDRIKLIDCAKKNKDVSIVKNFSREKKEILFILSEGEDPEVIMSFPPSYELILGKKRGELENSFRETLYSMPRAFPEFQPLSEIEKLDTKTWSSSNLKSYLHPELNNRTYYYKSDKGTIVPIFSDSVPVYSAANLFLGVVSEDRIMNISMKLYGFKEEGLVTTISQWLNYCRSNELDIYFAVEKEFSDHLLANITVAHPSLMYMHLLTVEIPLDIVSNDKSKIVGTIRTFIPTHNLNLLYQENEN